MEFVEAGRFSDFEGNRMMEVKLGQTYDLAKLDPEKYTARINFVTKALAEHKVKDKNKT